MRADPWQLPHPYSGDRHGDHLSIKCSHDCKKARIFRISLILTGVGVICAHLMIVTLDTSEHKLVMTASRGSLFGDRV